MILAERHIITTQDDRYKVLDNLCFLSKNLYNAALYNIRQLFFTTNKYTNYNAINNLFVNTKQVDYYNLPTKVSQQTLKLVDNNFKSFFSLLQKKLKGTYNSKVKIPRYLPKNGRYCLIYTSQAISIKQLKLGYIQLSGTDIKIKTNIKDVNQVRIIPKGNHIIIEVLYEAQEQPLKDNNNRYVSIDIGLNNLATLGSNVIKPIIINGKPIKAINQYYNKQKAYFQSKLIDRYNSNKLESLGLKRNNKIADYLHKASRYIINHLVSNNINTLVIGKNVGWKQEINIGCRNNQNFVTVPHAKFINMLEYKSKLAGINVIVHEESYTSKCSFLDNEAICKHEEYKGKRIKRGLFKSNSGKLINADLNGALNILRKVVGEFIYPIEVCSTPLKYSF